MLDSIHVGVTGLIGYQQGLRVIANNTANLHTPGYKSSTLQFADLLPEPGSGDGGQTRLGHGLDTAGTRLNFRQGDLRQTGNEFDLAVDGDGMFMLRDAQGELRYTRAGQFQFDGSGALVNRQGGQAVQGFDATGARVDVSIAGLRASPGKATATARFMGNLSSTQQEQTVSGIKVYDSRGGEHLLSLRFTSVDMNAGRWQVELVDAGITVATSAIVFEDGRPTAATRKLEMAYTAPGAAAQQVVFDFSTDATSFASGSLSTLAMTSQDGHAAGSLSHVGFDAEGILIATYTNGQTAKGARLALGRFSTPDAVQAVGGNLFQAIGSTAWLQGVAGEGGFGTIRAGMLEMSNVDLSREFSELVVMQRGYQASSQVISTANDMLQELFGMKRR